MDVKFNYLRLGNSFLDITPKAQAMKKESINWNMSKVNTHKLNVFQRIPLRNEKTAYRMGENLYKF